MQPAIEAVVDLIYEAAVIPELWPSALDGVASVSGTVGGLLFAVDAINNSTQRAPLQSGVFCVASESVSDLYASVLKNGWGGCIRGQRALARDETGFMTDADVCTPDEIERHPFYIYARKKGFGWAAGLSVKAPTGDSLLFNWERRFADGPMDLETIRRLDTIKGHLSRAALMASRLGLEKARAAAETLRILGLPAAVLSDRKRVLAMNGLFEELMPNVFDEHAGGKLHLVDRNADRLFDMANCTIALCGRGSVGLRNVMSIPLAAGAQKAMVVHVLPVRRSAHDVFDTASSIAIATPVRAGARPSTEIIRGLFDLTPAEARVARCIAAGDTIDDIAATSGTSTATVRTQLKAVFSKTGVSRQGALISLLAAISPVR